MHKFFTGRKQLNTCTWLHQMAHWLYAHLSTKV